MLGNLVDNAARATHGTGTVVLTVDGSSPEVAAVLVADDGPGVPEADRERVFDRLVRLDEARRTGDGGAGLGLPIARGIARAHGGDLVCEPGGGAAGAAAGSGRAAGGSAAGDSAAGDSTAGGGTAGGGAAGGAVFRLTLPR